MQKHSLVTKALDIQFHFFDLYAPWHRPTNENFNGLLRKYMAKYIDSDIERYVAKLKYTIS